MTESLSAEAMGDALCGHQIEPWSGRRIERAAMEAEANRLNENTFSIFTLRLDGDGVELVAKPDHLHIPILTDRAEVYRAFLAAVAAAHPLRLPVTIALEVGDQPLNGDFPFFSFQKIEGDPSILLPDVNLLEGEFYESDGFCDDIPFAAKSDKAVFVGSTSGSQNTLETIAAKRNQRIEAALFFKDHVSVDFWLPVVVQSDEAATAAIRALGLGDRIISWPEQFTYKFMLSLDGNGAACQRIAVALKSNAAVLKYRSRSVLHYFHGLVADTHYIPIDDDEEVLRLVADRAAYGRYEEVAAAGRDFFERYLNRRATIDYTAMLLDRYSRLDFG